MKNLVFFKSNNLKCKCGKHFSNQKALQKHNKNCPIHIHSQLDQAEAMCSKKKV